jgi:hypothetical protein
MNQNTVIDKPMELERGKIEFFDSTFVPYTIIEPNEETDLEKSVKLYESMGLTVHISVVDNQTFLRVFEEETGHSFCIKFKRGKFQHIE